MNDLNKALGDISSIRRQVARSTEFRGYGPATLAATGVFACWRRRCRRTGCPIRRNHISGLPGHLDLDRRFCRPR